MPNQTYIDQYINDGKKDARSLTKLYDTMLVGNVKDTSDIYRVPFNDFFLKYKHELENIIGLYQLDEEYFYKPKALSFMEYGTTEFWLAILRVNDMRSIAEFHQPIIYMYDADALLELVKVFLKREEKM